METEAIQRLFLRHTGPIKGFILGLVPDREAAEDVFQDVFLTASAKASEFQEGTDFPAWVRAIARFKALEHYRSGRAAPAPMDLGMLEGLADDAPVEAAEDWERRRAALDDCLKSVAPRAREVMGLRYAEGLLPPRIARRMAWSVSAVHVALSRARRFIRECAQRKLATGER